MSFHTPVRVVTENTVCQCLAAVKGQQSQNLCTDNWDINLTTGKTTNPKPTSFSELTSLLWTLHILGASLHVDKN